MPFLSYCADVARLRLLPPGRSGSGLGAAAVAAVLAVASYSSRVVGFACLLRNGTWVSCLGDTPAAGMPSPALDAPLEPAACLPCRWRGRRPVVVFLARETPPLPPIPVH
jgi:hypothetical protein